jgi:hypothetical protein
MISPALRHKLCLGLLCVYLPFSLALGLLHVDDLCSTGDGRLGVQAETHTSHIQIPDHSNCFACQFSAAHDLPVTAAFSPLSSAHEFVLLSAASTSYASLQYQSTRGPPFFTL